jgi:aspartate dehydrogenase
MRNISIFGCGNIGRIIARRAENVRIVAVYDRIADRAAEVAELCGAEPCASFTELLTHDCDTLVEAASPEGVREFAAQALSEGKDLVLLSVGGLFDNVFRERLEEIATAHGVRIRIPSGAIMGLDNLNVGAISDLTRLVLRTTKPPASLGVEVAERTCLLRGPASLCIERFPRNINVAAALSLASGREADVEIWADPQASRNVHQIFIEGEFGKAEIKVENFPCPDNPRTSYLAALSVLALLRDLDKPLIVGA